MQGNVRFQVGDASYTLAFTTNALCDLETDLDMGVMHIAGLLGDPERMRLRTVRAVFWAGLREHHPKLSQQEAGHLIDTLGHTRLLELITSAFLAAFPEAAGGDRPLPPGAPANGIGAVS